MSAWTQLLEPGPALLLLVVLLVPQTAIAAPFEQDKTEIEYYPVADSTGCYYNFQHYDEGDRIITNEPCLNCTCHNRMLMCYLRVCPFTKAIGQDCKVEKRPDQCCPVITCPEVPVQLLSSTTQSTSAVGHLDAYGCSIEGLFYTDGARVPSDPNKPCELCYCIRNKTACVMQQCTLEVEGCKPVYQEGVCCPVRYNCEHPDYNLLETTTRRLITTTEAPTTTLAGPTDCIYENEVYADGALIRSDKRCERCYCMKGDIVCAVQKCNPTPLDKVNCTALPPKEGQCCPDSYECEHMVEEELTTEYLFTTPSSVRLDESTTIQSELEEKTGVTQSPSEQENEVEEESTGPSTGKEGEVVQEPVTVLPIEKEPPKQVPELPDKEGQEKPSETGVTPSFDEASQVTESVKETEKPIGQVTETAELPGETDQQLNEIPEEHEIVTAGPHIPSYDEAESEEGTEASVGTESETEIPSASEEPAVETKQPEDVTEETFESKATTVSEIPSEGEEPKVTELPQKPETEEPSITKLPQKPKLEEGGSTELPEGVTGKPQEAAEEPTEPAIAQESEEGKEIGTTTSKPSIKPEIETVPSVQKPVEEEEGELQQTPVEDEYETEIPGQDQQPELPQSTTEAGHPQVIQQVTETAPEIGTGLPQEIATETSKEPTDKEEQVTEEEVRSTGASFVPITQAGQAPITEPSTEDEGKGTEKLEEAATQTPEETPKEFSEEPISIVQAGTTLKPLEETPATTEQPKPEEPVDISKPYPPVLSTESPEQQEEKKITEMPTQQEVTEGTGTEIPKQQTEISPKEKPQSTVLPSGEEKATIVPEEYTTQLAETEKSTKAPKKEDSELPSKLPEGTELPPKDITESPEGESTELPERTTTRIEGIEKPVQEVEEPKQQDTEVPEISEKETEIYPKEGTEKPLKEVEEPKEQGTEIPEISEKETELYPKEGAEKPVQEVEEPKQQATEVPEISEKETEIYPKEGTEKPLKEAEEPKEQGTEIPEISEKATELYPELVTSPTVPEVETPTEHIPKAEYDTEQTPAIIPQEFPERLKPISDTTESQEQVTEKQEDTVTKLPEGPKQTQIPEIVTSEPGQEKATEIPESQVTEKEGERTTEKLPEGTKQPVVPQLTEVEKPKQPEIITEGKLDETTKYAEEQTPIEEEIPEQPLEPERLPGGEKEETERPVEKETEVGATATSAPKEFTKLPAEPQTEESVTEEKPRPSSTEGVPSIESEVSTEKEISEGETVTPAKPSDGKKEEEKTVTERIPTSEDETTTVKIIPEQEITELPQQPVEGGEQPIPPTEELPSKEGGATTTKYVPEKEIPSSPQTTAGIQETTTQYPKYPSVSTELPSEEVTSEPKATEKPEEPTVTEISEGTTLGPSEKGEVSDQTTEKPEEERGIPGEGSCLVDGQTYRNNSDVPPINLCQVSCKCLSSILQCLSVECTPPPSNLQHCMPVYAGPDSCCPTYSCSVPGVTGMESDSHKMETTTVKEPSEGPIDINIIIPSEEGTLRPEGTTLFGRDSTELPEFILPGSEIPEQIPEGTEHPIIATLPQETTDKLLEPVPSETIAPVEKETPLPTETEQKTKYPELEITTPKSESQPTEVETEYPKGVEQDETRPQEEIPDEEENEIEEDRTDSYGVSATSKPEYEGVTEAISELGKPKIPEKETSEYPTVTSSGIPEVELTTVKPSEAAEGVTQVGTIKPEELPELVTEVKLGAPEAETTVQPEESITQEVPESATRAKQPSVSDVTTGKPEDLTIAETGGEVTEEITKISEQEQIVTTEKVTVVTSVPATVQELEEEITQKAPERDVTESPKEEVPAPTTEFQKPTVTEVRTTEGKPETPEVGTQPSVTKSEEQVTEKVKEPVPQYDTGAQPSEETEEPVTSSPGEEKSTPKSPEQSTEAEILQSVTEVIATEKIPESISHVTDKTPEDELKQGEPTTRLPEISSEKPGKKEEPTQSTTNVAEGGTTESTAPISPEQLPEETPKVTTIRPEYELLGEKEKITTAEAPTEKPIKADTTEASEKESEPSEVTEKEEFSTTKYVPETSTISERLPEEKPQSTTLQPSQIPEEQPARTTSQPTYRPEEQPEGTTLQPTYIAEEKPEGSTVKPGYIPDKQTEKTTLVPEEISEGTTIQPASITEEATIIQELPESGKEEATVRYGAPEASTTQPETAFEKDSTTPSPAIVPESSTSSEALPESSTTIGKGEEPSATESTTPSAKETQKTTRPFVYIPPIYESGSVPEYDGTQKEGELFTEPTEASVPEASTPVVTEAEIPQITEKEIEVEGPRVTGVPQETEETTEPIVTVTAVPAEKVPESSEKEFIEPKPTEIPTYEETQPPKEKLPEKEPAETGTELPEGTKPSKEGEAEEELISEKEKAETSTESLEQPSQETATKVTEKAITEGATSIPTTLPPKVDVKEKETEVPSMEVTESTKEELPESTKEGLLETETKVPSQEVTEPTKEGVLETTKESLPETEAKVPSQEVTEVTKEGLPETGTERPTQERTEVPKEGAPAETTEQEIVETTQPTKAIPEQEQTTEERVDEGATEVPSLETTEREGLPEEGKGTEAEVLEATTKAAGPITTQPPKESTTEKITEKVSEITTGIPLQETTEAKKEGLPELGVTGIEVTEEIVTVTAQPGLGAKPSTEGEVNATEIPAQKPEEGSTEYISPTSSEKPEVATTIRGEEIPESRPSIPGEGQEPTESKPEEPFTSPTLIPTTQPSSTELFTSGPKQESSTKISVPGELSTSAPSTPITTSTTAPPQLPEEPDYQGQVEEDYEEDQSAFGPGTCRYGGKVYVSAQQIPRDDPCDFCFCFRSDIICLQQSCPPPIPRCHEEPIRGFCCPRYECPVSMATSVNITTTTTTTTTTLPPHFLSHAYKGRAHRTGCQIQGRAYQIGEEIKSASGPCLHCTCGGNGQMKCDPKACSPEPMLRQMIAAAESRRRR